MAIQSRLTGATICLLFVLFISPARADSPGLVVHEWGTFTALQDDDGNELTGINIDDEPVPAFVHNLNPRLLGNSVLSNQHWIYRQKGAPRRHPRVTIRLETPVIYFYPPKGRKEMTLDVSATFRGGWLTEFYPNAEAEAPGMKPGIFDFGELTPDTQGSLTWRDVHVGREGKLPQTEENVWLAPRRVNAAPITMPNGESEKYIFYRGVGRMQAPLSISRTCKARDLVIRGNFAEVLDENQTVKINDLWLIDIREDGTSAFRTVDPIEVDTDDARVVGNAVSSFEKSDYSAENLPRMKSLMHAALVTDGLFADEAAALLETWQRAYFVSPGLRLFFLVPRPWTDYYLPLTLSESASVERVMVGRIELITDRQRKLLKELAQNPVSDGKWINQITNGTVKGRFLSGRSDFGDLGVEIPADYQRYLDLGRFRNALVVAEERQRPTESLTTFINVNGLHPFRWQKPASVATTESE